MADRLVVEPIGDPEIKQFLFAIPGVSGANVRLSYEQAMQLAHALLVGAAFDSAIATRPAAE